MGILVKPKEQKKTRMTVRQYFALPTDEPFETLRLYGELITTPRPFITLATWWIAGFAICNWVSSSSTTT